MIEHLDVLIVGAGLSGIGAGHYIQTDTPWASYAIFEARGSMGGTWDLFRYPGIRSDSDMFTLGYSFRPWDGRKAIADGGSILQYIKDTAAAEGIDRKIRYHHRVIAANWSTDDAVWHVTAERSDTGEVFELTAGFIFSCSGYYRYDRGYQPDFEGMERFGGQVVHPQFWPEDLDYAGKKVVVIGSGATAITLIPSMADQAGHITMLQRSPTYITAAPEVSPVSMALRRLLPDHRAGVITRWVHAVGTQLMFQLCRRFPRQARQVLLKGVAAQLPNDFDVDKHFTPSYDPWDQRLCVVPNGDLFKAIRGGKASVVTDHIAHFDQTGIALKGGDHLEADIVVTATGLELLFIGGIELSVDGTPVDIADRMAYKGMMLEGVPNLALAIGYTNASWTLKCDLTCQYVTRLLTRMHDQGLQQCTAVNSDSSIVEEPLLGLSSGYVQRAAGLAPKQGSRAPWKVYQSYLQDYRALRMSGIDDDAMTFSNPVGAQKVSA